MILKLVSGIGLQSIHMNSIFGKRHFWKIRHGISYFKGKKWGLLYFISSIKFFTETSASNAVIFVGPGEGGAPPLKSVQGGSKSSPPLERVPPPSEDFSEPQKPSFITKIWKNFCASQGKPHFWKIRPAPLSYSPPLKKLRK